VNQDTWLNCSPHIDQIKKKDAQIIGVFGPLLNWRSGLSIINGVPLLKQLIRHMMDYTCPIRRFFVHTHVGRLRILHSKCLRLATGAPWNVGSRQIQEDFAVSLFVDHVRALIASFNLESADVGILCFGSSAETYADRGFTLDA
jgi:hypothetical protein